ncbi:MAG TPA: M24 family metallopeptidase [Rhizomicrobium sp.]|jgi:Xaa-Pro aminopeptidase|nr:M24 family metallopeptidase [Rhizomicrobium sp.]
MSNLFAPIEDSRRAELERTQAKALKLFDAIERDGLIRAGVTERQVEDEIGALAEREFGVEKHWHRRIVRAGANSVTIAGDNPTVRTIAKNDIVYVDLGPVFEAWEADIGKSYVLGDDPEKRRLAADLPRLFEQVRTHYQKNPGMSGAELYAYAQKAAGDAGWRFGGQIAGHIVSEFAHALIPGDKALNRIGPLNPKPMTDPDGKGQHRHWILEIHLVAQDGSFGGFYERLL